MDLEEIEKLICKSLIEFFGPLDLSYAYDKSFVRVAISKPVKLQGCGFLFSTNNSNRQISRLINIELINAWQLRYDKKNKILL